MSRFRATGWGGVALLVLLVIGVYAPHLHHAFQYDDEWKIVRNVRLRDLHWFVEDFRLGAYSEAVTRLLPNLSLALDYRRWQLDPFGYHLTNMLLHATNVVLVFTFARALAARLGRATEHFAWLAAALFAVHPLNSEAVYYANARPNLMLTTFGLCALCLLPVAIEAREASLGKRALAWLGFGASLLAALLCKEVAVAWLAIAPTCVLFLSYARPEPYARWVRRGLPIGLALGALALGLLFLTSALAEVQRILTTRSPAEQAITFADQSAIVFRYLGLWLMPWPGFLLIDHGALGHAYQRYLSSGSASVLLWPVLALVALCALLGFATTRRKSAPLPVFAAVFAALAHLPIWLMPRGEAMVEYRVYLPMVGLCMLLAYVLDRGSAWLAARLGEGPEGLRRSGYALLLALLCVASGARGRAWETEESMWRDVLAKAPNTHRAYVNLGEIARKRGDADEAIRLTVRSLELNPMEARAHANLGGLLAMRGQLEDAARSLKRALAIDPQDAQAALNLGNVMSAMNENEWAARYYEEALKIQSSFPEAELNLAQILRKSGRLEDSLPHYRRALALAPDMPAVYLMMGRALYEHGEVAEAIATWERGLALDERQPAMHAQLGMALMNGGRHADGLPHVTRALELAPNNPEVREAARLAKLR